MAEPAEMLLLVISDVLLERAAPHPQSSNPRVSWLRKGCQGRGKVNTKIKTPQANQVIVSMLAPCVSWSQCQLQGKGMRAWPRKANAREEEEVCLFVWEASWGCIITAPQFNPI